MAVLQARLASLMRASLKPSSFVLPRNPVFSPPTMNPITRRCGLLRIYPKSIGASVPVAGRFQMIFDVQRRLAPNLSLSGRKFAGSLFGFSAVVGATNQMSNVAYAIDDDHPDDGETSVLLKEDLHSAWSLARKYRLLALLFTTVFMGCMNPITLAFNIAILLLCTRPNPLSVYIFIEQWRQRDMGPGPKFLKSKWYYTKRVDVRDYKLLCFATVELSGTRLNLIGILGDWWVLRSSPT